MAGDILVVAEHEGGKLDSVTLELIGKGRELGDKLGRRLAVLVLGAEISPLAAELADKGMDAVIAIDDSRLQPYTPEAHTAAIYEVVKEVQPLLVLFGHTYRGIETAPALATRLDVAFVSNCVDLETREGAIFAIRPVYEGTMRARVRLDGPSPWIVSIQKGALPARQLAAKKAEILSYRVAIPDESLRTRVVGMIEPPRGETDVTKADILVSVGRGIKGKDHVRLAEELAQALGAVVACSRPISDLGWLPPDRHVGMSGKTVSPRVYLACGISGASQHAAGMKDSQTIIVINKDASAPIFRIAHYGVIGDLFQVMPALTQEARQQDRNMGNPHGEAG